MISNSSQVAYRRHGRGISPDERRLSTPKLVALSVQTEETNQTIRLDRTETCLFSSAPAVLCSGVLCRAMPFVAVLE